jgi:hypothetical protein
MRHGALKLKNSWRSVKFWYAEAYVGVTWLAAKRLVPFAGSQLRMQSQHSSWVLILGLSFQPTNWRHLAAR